MSRRWNLNSSSKGHAIRHQTDHTSDLVHFDNMHVVIVESVPLTKDTHMVHVRTIHAHAHNYIYIHTQTHMCIKQAIV